MFNKDIDRLFQEKFKDFEVQPDDKIWKGIDKQLNANKRKFFVSKIVGIVATVLLLISFWYFQNVNTKAKIKTDNGLTNTSVKKETVEVIVSNQSSVRQLRKTNIIENNVTNVTTSAIKNVKKTNSISYLKTILASKRPIKINISKHTNFKSVNSTLIARVDVLASKVNDYFYENSKLPVKNKTNSFFKMKLKPVILSDTFFEGIDLSNEKLNIKEIVKSDIILRDKTYNKWQVGLDMSPIYYASMGKGSPIDSKIATSEKTNSNSYAYGFNLAYSINKKWAIKTGVRKTNLSYKTLDVGLDFEVITNYSNVNSNRGPFAVVPMDHVNNTTNMTFIGNIKQELNYIEVPLEVKYNLLNKKIGININSGISTMFLDDNRISFERDLNNFELGEATNVNKISYSVNLGFDTNYNISDAWKYSISPIFKYHLNAFSSNDGGFRPYSLGISTGLYYNF